MTPRTALLALALAAGCAPASVSALIDAGAPSDTPAVDAGAMDVPAAQDVPATPADAGLLPPSDLGAFPRDSGLGDPPWVPVDVRTMMACEPLMACGGDVVGTWDVSGGCIEVPLGEALGRCPGARVTRAEGRARGRVTFTGAVAIRAAQWSAEVEVFVPALCASFVGGCAGIQAAMRAVSPTAVCAAEGIGDCRCAARQTGELSDGDGYTTSRDQIVSATLQRRWDYCVRGARLRYRDASPTGPREPGIIELTRRSM